MTDEKTSEKTKKMIAFWDSSSIIPLILKEEKTDQSMTLFKKTEKMLVWEYAQIECFSAICKKEKTGDLNYPIFKEALQSLYSLTLLWNEITPLSLLAKTLAKRMISSYGLRTLDALQLAAALISCNEDVKNLTFIT
ncbi:MAG: hypothetical protein HY072_04615, partial [Deltaproteobacteria bacterium]|nr:hypothetical protein [Deltaproteobacteria bacterium]